MNLARVSNPTSLRHAITTALAEEGWPPPEWFATSPAEGGGDQAKAAVRSGVDVLFACGGDGTVRVAASAAAGTSVAIAILPSGTANVLALNLRVPSDVTRAIWAATRGGRRRIDLGTVDDLCFTVAAGMGLDARLLRDTRQVSKRRLGWPAYVVAAIRHLGEPRFPVRVYLDDQSPLERPVRSVVVANVGRLPGGVNLVRGAVPDDGLLDVVLIAPQSLHGWVVFLLSVMGSRRRGKHIETFRARHVLVTASAPQARQLDGDALPSGRTLDVAVWPAALTVCVPLAT